MFSLLLTLLSLFQSTLTQFNNVYTDCVSSGTGIDASFILYQNDALQSIDGKVRFVMQNDGNLCLHTHNATDGNWIDRFCTNQVGSGSGNYLAVSSNGNLAQFNADQQPMWSSGVYSSLSPHSLCVSNCGYAVMFNRDGNILWYSNYTINIGYPGYPLCAPLNITRAPTTPIPSMDPTQEPTINPTMEPTQKPTTEPSMEPTMTPTFGPSFDPTPAPFSPAFYSSLSKENNISSILISESAPFFWICATYATSAFIYGLLYFLCETLPSFNQISDKKAASSKQIWRESLKHSTLNNQQFIVDVIDIITDIMFLINVYVFYDTYYSLGVLTFIVTACLIFFIYAKWMFLKYSSLNNKIFNDMINFDLFIASFNAIQACTAFYILSEDEWNAIMFIKVILIGYLMLIKLARAVFICIAKTSKYSEPHEVNQVKQIMLVDTNKLMSTSNEEEQVVESKEVEIEMGDYVNTGINVESEESKESKESKEKSDSNSMKILTEINSFANFDETKQLLINLNNDAGFAIKYEEQWNKNVILLVKGNQKMLRNKSMKPIVKQYVKSLEKEKGDDYVKFMNLLQNKKKISNDDDEITIKC